MRWGKKTIVGTKEFTEWDWRFEPKGAAEPDAQQPKPRKPAPEVPFCVKISFGKVVVVRKEMQRQWGSQVHVYGYDTIAICEDCGKTECRAVCETSQVEYIEEVYRNEQFDEVRAKRNPVAYKFDAPGITICPGGIK